MNQKGFTLVEIIVTIGLLALIGVGIGFSLNKVFKNQEENSYEIFIEKIKSSSLLYSSNSSTIMNDLEFNNGYILISMDDLIKGGYVRDNLKNPNTNENLKELGTNENGEDYSQARVYYSKDKEMMIEYPFIKPEENIYLNVINYTTIYKTNESNLCYKGLNTSSLGLTLVESGGLLDKILVAGNDIVAYMEDGSKCTDDKLNTSKVGTYKIRYVYTTDGTIAENNSNAKSAVRYIIVKPTKPKINDFTIENEDTSNVYKAKMLLNVSDVEGINLRYCLVATKTDESPDIKRCQGEQNTGFAVNKWLPVSNKNTDIEKSFDIDTLLSDLINEKKIVFYVYVRNDFDEYTFKRMMNENDLGENAYILTSTLKIHLNTHSDFSNQTFYSNVNKSNTLSADYIVRDIVNEPNKTKLSTILDNNSDYKKPITASYYFTGWVDKNGNAVALDKEIFGVVDIYAKWAVDTTNPKCDINVSSSGLSGTSSDAESGVASTSWTNGTTLSVKTHSYTVIDYALNTKTCNVRIKNMLSYEEVESKTCYDSYEECTTEATGAVYLGRGPRDTYECKQTYGPNAWYTLKGYNGEGCYKNKYEEVCTWHDYSYDCSESYTVYYCPDGYDEIRGTSKCYNKS